MFQKMYLLQIFKKLSFTQIDRYKYRYGVIRNKKLHLLSVLIYIRCLYEVKTLSQMLKCTD